VWFATGLAAAGSRHELDDGQPEPGAVAGSAGVRAAGTGRHLHVIGSGYPSGMTVETRTSS
jgi:hypothetical protein